MPGIPALGRMRQEDGEFQANPGCPVRKTKVGSGAGRVHFCISLALCSLGACGLWGTYLVSVPGHLWQRVWAHSCLHSSAAVSPSHLVPGLGCSLCLLTLVSSLCSQELLT